jgi:hypothetical protein
MGDGKIVLVDRAACVDRVVGWLRCHEWCHVGAASPDAHGYPGAGADRVRDRDARAQFECDHALQSTPRQQ